jgi:hypothetical protein
MDVSVADFSMRQKQQKQFRSRKMGYLLSSFIRNKIFLLATYVTAFIHLTHHKHQCRCQNYQINILFLRPKT